MGVLNYCTLWRITSQQDLVKLGNYIFKKNLARKIVTSKIIIFFFLKFAIHFTLLHG